jgi:membrane-associated phospholipid phosphatase
VSTAFFGASAACAHHQALPLYGHPLADWGICALLLTTATANGALRIVSDTHWASDVVAGALIGVGAGYGLAYALHYGSPNIAHSRLQLLPTIVNGRPGAMLSASW